MDRARAIDRLPEAHALALRLSDDGLDEHQIADRLQIPPQAVPPLIRIAEAKVARLQKEASEMTI